MIALSSGLGVFTMSTRGGEIKGTRVEMQKEERATCHPDLFSTCKIGIGIQHQTASFAMLKLISSYIMTVAGKIQWVFIIC